MAEEQCHYQKAAQKLPQEKIAGKFLIGELHNEPHAEYTAEYDKLM